MSDSVTVEFRGDKSQFNSVRDQVRADARDIANTPITPGSGSGSGGAAKGAKDFQTAYAGAFDDLSARAARLNNQVATMARERYQAGGGGPFKFFEEGASAAEKQAQALESKLVEMQVALGRAIPGTGKYALAEAELKSYEAELARYEVQLASVSTAEAASAEARSGESLGGLVTGTGRIRGLGPVFRATGLYNYGIDETTLNAANALSRAASGIAGSASAAASSMVITNEAELSAYAAAKGLSIEQAKTALAAEATAAAMEETATAAAAVDAEILLVSAVFLPLVAAAAIFAIYSHDASTAAEAKKDAEFAAAAAMNRQLQYQQGITAEINKQIRDAKSGRELSTYTDELKGRSVEELKDREASLKAQIYSPDGSAREAATVYNKEQGKYVLSAEDAATQEDRVKKLVAIQNELYNKQQATLHDQSFSNLGDAGVDIARQKQEEFNKEVDESRKKVQEMARSWKTAFENLYTAEASDNPFARQMVANAKAVESLKLQLVGLPPELKASALAMQSAQNESKLFELGLKNAFDVIDLRALERKFDITQPRFVNQASTDAYARYQARQDVDAKLREAGQARTPDEQSAADRAVTQLAKTLDPKNLDIFEKIQIAQAIERNATDTENQRRDAVEVQKRLATVLEKLEANEKGLLGNIETGGRQALDIVLKDSTTDQQVTRATAATTGDTDKVFNLEFVGGSNR